MVNFLLKMFVFVHSLVSSLERSEDIVLSLMLEKPLENIHHISFHVLLWCLFSSIFQDKFITCIRQLLEKVVLTYMTSTFGLERTLAK